MTVSAVKLPLDSAFENRVVFESQAPEGRQETLDPNITRVTAGDRSMEMNELEAAVSLQLNEFLNLDMLQDSSLIGVYINLF